MKTIVLSKNEVVNGVKQFIGSRQIEEPETWVEFVELINDEKPNAMSDWKSGRRVRIQREIAGSTSQTDKLDKLAKSEGFNSFDEMVRIAKGTL